MFTHIYIILYQKLSCHGLRVVYSWSMLVTGLHAGIRGVFILTLGQS